MTTQETAREESRHPYPWALNHTSVCPWTGGNLVAIAKKPLVYALVDLAGRRRRRELG